MEAGCLFRDSSPFDVIDFLAVDSNPGSDL
jgi:hypothetical protein